jgi:acyl-coenzyme A synthetase/AMP-(fatty) acid ligase
MFDRDGYLLLTGRLKELIKRGGEQVSPLEVDGVLSEHPAVAQALTFSIPHPMLGEEVGAAVVLREGMACTERELRDHAAQHLADFKVPRKVVFLAEIPKGATGKLMRIGLAEKLGLVG